MPHRVDRAVLDVWALRRENRRSSFGRENRLRPNGSSFGRRARATETRVRGEALLRATQKRRGHFGRMDTEP